MASIEWAALQRPIHRCATAEMLRAWQLIPVLHPFLNPGIDFGFDPTNTPRIKAHLPRECPFGDVRIDSTSAFTCPIHYLIDSNDLHTHSGSHRATIAKMEIPTLSFLRKSSELLRPRSLEAREFPLARWSEFQGLPRRSRQALQFQPNVDSLSAGKKPRHRVTVRASRIDGADESLTHALIIA